MFLQEQKPIQVFVRDMTGKTGETITLNVKATDTIMKVKTEIGIIDYKDILDTRVRFQSSLLEDDMTFGDYNIQNESTLQLAPPKTFLVLFILCSWFLVLDFGRLSSSVVLGLASPPRRTTRSRC